MAALPQRCVDRHIDPHHGVAVGRVGTGQVGMDPPCKPSAQGAQLCLVEVFEPLPGEFSGQVERFGTEGWRFLKLDVGGRGRAGIVRSQDFLADGAGGGRFGSRA